MTGDNAKAAREFALEIDQAWAAKGQDILDLTVEISLQALRGIVLMSPVDSGRFRGNWITSVDAPDLTQYAEARDKSAPIIEADQKLGALDAVPNAVYLQNNLPYANRLENGWSKIQAPQGMVGVTMANIVATYSGKEV